MCTLDLTCLKYWSGLVLNRLPSVAEISASKMMPWLVPTRMGPVLISLPSSLFQPTLSMRWPRQRDRLRTFCVFLLRYRHSLVLRLMSRWEPAGREGERHDGGHGFCCSYESRGQKASWIMKGLYGITRGWFHDLVVSAHFLKSARKNTRSK